MNAMKMLLYIADATRLDAIRGDLHELGASGYSVMPVIEGSGATGVHAGDRVHPGALVSVFVVAAEERAPALFDELIRRRDAAGDRVSRIFVLPVERQG